MNSSTSWFWTSRKYSAIVSADSATRRRVPGGSSIWPKTRAVWPMTPASSISTIRSLPSRVRSPTPANTDTPPWSLATRAIISWISTVLPTPAPPNRPILPPWTYGVSRSMTLMPVSNIWVFDSSWSKAGALRWMPHRSLTSSSSPSSRLRRLAQHVEDVALGHVADGHRDRAAGVDHLRAAHEAVGRLQRDGADHAVADVLRDLEGEGPRLATERELALELVVDLGHRVDGVLDVDDGADHPRDPAGGSRAGLLGLFDRCSHVSSPRSLASAWASASAFTPPTISLISWVMPA